MLTRSYKINRPKTMRLSQQKNLRTKARRTQPTKLKSITPMKLILKANLLLKTLPSNRSSQRRRKLFLKSLSSPPKNLTSLTLVEINLSSKLLKRHKKLRSKK